MIPPVTGISALVFVVLGAACADRPVESKSRPPAPVEPPPEPQLDAAVQFPLAPLPVAPGESEANTLRDLGAIPIWQGVVDRYRYLERRGDSGIVFGVVGPAIEEGRSRYLIDDTEGEGRLGAPLKIPPGVSLEPGQRVAAWGAWHVLGAEQWIWRPTRIALLKPGAAPSAAPNLKPAPPRAPPHNAHPPDRAAAGAVIVFVVRNKPLKVGDGWEISREDAVEPVARLVLPGERGAYGGQDMRSDHENWRLSLGGRYQIEVERVYHYKTIDRIPVIYARDAPAGVLR